MAKLAPARRVAADALKEQRVRGARMRDLLRASQVVAALDERDRAFATRLAMGVVRTGGLLDAAMKPHLRAGIHLEPRVRDAMRIATFELLYMSTPLEVAVSQGVELVRLANRRAAGLANAVLRHVAAEDAPALVRARDRLAAGEVDVRDVARVGALPAWLAQEILDSCGADEAASLALSALDAPLPTVAGNRARRCDEETLVLLKEAGCDPSAGLFSGSFVLGRQGRLASSGLVESADVVPCDLAAQEVVRELPLRPAAKVLEVGQGRGTKTLLMQNAAIAVGGPCKIVAIDLDEWKSRLSARRMKAAGLEDHVACMTFDARGLESDCLPTELGGAFDLVFVDAPCTGTGTLCRHPEIAWSLKPAAAQELAGLQLQILSAASCRVAPGGVLAYATCSLLKAENEAVVEAFLASEKGRAFGLVAPACHTAIPRADRHFLAQFCRRQDDVRARW